LDQQDVAITLVEYKHKGVDAVAVAYLIKLPSALGGSGSESVALFPVS
jgi:hypothetical protein